MSICIYTRNAWGLPRGQTPGVSTIINQGINYHQLSGYQLSSTIRVSAIINYQGINYHQLSEYQLSSTIRVSTIINYQGISTIINQGINYHQLSGYQLSSTIRVSTIYIYHQLSGYINYHQPGYQLSSTIRASTIINYQLSGYQVSSNTTFFLSKFPPPLSWQPMLSRIFKYNILFIKISPPPLATNAFNDFQIQHYFYQNFPPPLWQPMHSMIFKYNIFLIKMSPPPPSLGNQCIQSFSNPTFYLSSTIRVYQLSSTRVSTIINYQGINYHQLSTIRVSIIIKYNILFIKISPPPPPSLGNQCFQGSSNTTFFLSKFPPPSLGNQCFQGSSNTTFFLSKFPPPLWQPMHSIIFKYNIF